MSFKLILDIEFTFVFQVKMTALYFQSLSAFYFYIVVLSIVNIGSLKRRDSVLNINALCYGSQHLQESNY